MAYGLCLARGLPAYIPRDPSGDLWLGLVEGIESLGRLKCGFSWVWQIMKYDFLTVRLTVRVLYPVEFHRTWRGKEMAKIILWGETATQWYAYAARQPSAAFPIWRVPACEVRPRAGTSSYLGSCLPFLSRPYHVAVFSPRDRRVLQDVRCHVAPASVHEAPHCLVASGVLVPDPALALMEQSRGRTVAEVAAAGAALCSGYALLPAGGITERHPLTSPATIRAACGVHGDVPGHSVVEKSLPWIVPAAASPREWSLALVLSLPGRLGGYGLPVPALNVPLEIGDRIRILTDCSYYIADLYWPSSQLIVEYDSDEYHLTSCQHHHDAVRRMVLEEMGYRVITVTRLQLNDPKEMERVAKVVASVLGRQLRIRCREFHRRQRELWAVVGLARTSS